METMIKMDLRKKSGKIRKQECFDSRRDSRRYLVKGRIQINASIMSASFDTMVKTLCGKYYYTKFPYDMGFGKINLKDKDKI